MSAPHTERAHAKLSASASDRWMNCPGSVRLCEGMENRSSEYAAEGTAAHELAEKCLRSGLDADKYLDEVIHVADKSNPGGGWDFTVDEDMAGAVQVYLDFVRPKMAGREWDIEQRFDLSSLYPDMFGTGDLVIYDDKELVLDINDYKHGRGHAVDAYENPQLLYYAVGAILKKHNRGIRKISLNIIQPRCPHVKGPIRTWDIAPSDLLDWKADLVAAAKATEAPDAPLNPGDWCKWCPAAGVCPRLHEKALVAAQGVFSKVVNPTDPRLMTKEELALRLEQAAIIEDWLRRLREYAHQEAEAGRRPPGYKLVQKRATRKWTDAEAAQNELQAQFGLSRDAIFAEPKLKTPAQVEKLLAKHQKGLLADLVSRESSGTTLVHESDPREPVRAAIETIFSVMS